jgi:hypothetical protein
MDHTVPNWLHQKSSQPYYNQTIPYPNHLILRGPHTAYDRELDYHDSYTFYKG